VVAARWRHRVSPNGNLSWGRGGCDTPLCPSTHRKAERKFSVREDSQEWGWGPQNASGPRNTVHEPGQTDSSWRARLIRI
jgi:hypothetical protein